MDPLRRLLRYAAPHRLVIAGAPAAMVLYGVASAALAWLIKPILDSVLPAREQLGFVGTAIIVVYVVKGLGAFLSSYWMDDLGHRVVRSLRNQLFEHTLGQSAAFFARRTAGQLLSRVNNDVGQVQRAVSETVGDLARESLTVVGYAGLLLYIDAGLAVVCVAGVLAICLSTPMPVVGGIQHVPHHLRCPPLLLCNIMERVVGGDIPVLPGEDWGI